MDTLKLALTTAPALKPITYDSTGQIVLSVDSSLQGWGAILQQEEAESTKRHPARYESGMWTDAEKKYDAGKLECRGLLKVLKKLRYYLYGIRFLVEIDARTLVHQLNQPASDLPGSVVNRWLAWIRMFTFEIKHVAGRRHGGPDALSRRGKAEEDSEEEDPEELEASMDADLAPAQLDDNGEEMPDEWKKVKLYLETLQRPNGMTDKAFDTFKQYALRFLVHEGLLFRRSKPNMPPRRVIWDADQQKRIVEELHDESGHRGKKGTYEKVSLRYWWKGLYRDVENWVKTCRECQMRASVRATEELHPTLHNTLWSKVGLDVVYMPKDAGFSKIVAMRDYLSGWVEAKAIRNADSSTIAPFVHDWICRFGLMGALICDNGPENKGLTIELVKRYRIKNVRISSYHSQANGLVERGHQPIVNALSKMGKRWVRNLPLVLWADRITTRASTGFPPYKLVFGQDCVLPVELDAASWTVVEWERVKTLEELLVARAKQLDRNEEDIHAAQDRIKASRLKNKAHFDKRRRKRAIPLKEGDMVLLHNTVLEKQWSKKLDNHWLGPYIIREARLDLGTYLLNELDGTRLQGTYAGDRLKRFYPRTGVDTQNQQKEIDSEHDSEQSSEDSSESEEDSEQGPEEENEGFGALEP